MANANAAANGGGAGDVFLKVKGSRHGLIKGEAQDTDHKDEIEIVSWSWGMEAKTAVGGGTASGKATIRELRLVKKVDSASTALMGALRTNEPIQTAVLSLRRAGKGQHEYLKITIGDARVTSLDVEVDSASTSADLLERVSFAFNKIEIVYTPQGQDGQPKGSTTFVDEWGTAN